MTTVMVRMRPQTRDKLREMSEREGITAVELLDRLVQEHEETRLIAALTADLNGPAAAEELAAWDAGSWDGLDPSEDFSWIGSDRKGAA